MNTTHTAAKTLQPRCCNCTGPLHTIGAKCDHCHKYYCVSCAKLLPENECQKCAEGDYEMMCDAIETEGARA